MGVRIVLTGASSRNWSYLVTDDWPSHSEELSRKALDVFMRAVYKHQEFKMTGSELRIVIDTLVDTISGLVPRDVLDTIYSARKELGL
jgi:hypothetical protein